MSIGSVHLIIVHDPMYYFREYIDGEGIQVQKHQRHYIKAIDHAEGVEYLVVSCKSMSIDREVERNFAGIQLNRITIIDYVPFKVISCLTHRIRVTEFTPYESESVEKFSIYTDEDGLMCYEFGEGFFRGDPELTTTNQIMEVLYYDMFKEYIPQERGIAIHIAPRYHRKLKQFRDY